MSLLISFPLSLPTFQAVMTAVEANLAHFHSLMMQDVWFSKDILLMAFFWCSSCRSSLRFLLPVGSVILWDILSPHKNIKFILFTHILTPPFSVFFSPAVISSIHLPIKHAPLPVIHPFVHPSIPRGDDHGLMPQPGCLISSSWLHLRFSTLQFHGRSN